MKTALQVKMQQHRSVNPVGNILPAYALDWP